MLKKKFGENPRPIYSRDMSGKPPIVQRDLIDGLVVLAETFKQHGISYAVIGGMATGFRSQPRFTKDVDVLLRVPQLLLPAVLDTLSERGFEFDLLATIRAWTQEHMVVLSYHGLRVDWLKPVIPIYDHILDRATEETWLNHPIRVASVEGLILLKLLAFRTQDQLDIENLVAAHRDNLDLDWIHSEWQTVAPLDDPRMIRFHELLDRTR
jgi:Nucleotidyl transferase of unknown function (DUF2204)